MAQLSEDGAAVGWPVGWLSRADIDLVGYTLPEMLRHCSYAGVDCAPPVASTTVARAEEEAASKESIASTLYSPWPWWSKTYDPAFGNCYTFSAKALMAAQTPATDGRARGTGPAFALQLALQVRVQ